MAHSFNDYVRWPQRQTMRNVMELYYVLGIPARSPAPASFLPLLLLLPLLLPLPLSLTLLLALPLLLPLLLLSQRLRGHMPS